MDKPKSLKTELIAGVTTFFTMAYIVIVNPAILSTPGTGMPFNGVLTATVVLSFTMTLLMGWYAKLPFAVAPGMGINAFFTYTIILGQKVPWQVALGMVFWAGVLFVIASVTPLRVALARAIPDGIRKASAAGIGIFLTFIGLKNSGLVVSDPVTFVRLGHYGPSTLLSVFGLLVTVALLQRRTPFAFLGGIFLTTVLGWVFGLVHAPEQWTGKPDFESVFLRLDILGALQVAFVPAIISIFFTDLFDSISTFVGVSQATGMLDSKGEPKNLKEGLLVDAFATLGAGAMGTSSGTAYIESAAGIEMGGRTGWTAIFAALCFLPCLFLAPAAGMVPAFATAPVLILVGALMFRGVGSLQISKLEDSVPAFLTLVMIPLTFSITQGILWGISTHVVFYLFAGRRRELSAANFAVGAVCVGLMILEQLR
jgi:adenine/guanine/hypoxanthine permease